MSSSSLDLVDLLDQSESALARLRRHYGAALWRAVRGAPPPDYAAHQDKLERLLTQDTLLMRLEAAHRRESMDPVIRRRAARWLSLALTCQSSRESGQPGRRRQVAAVIESFRGSVGRERPDLDGLRDTILRDADRGRREQAYQSLVSLSRSVLPLIREGLALEAQTWSPARHGGQLSYWRQPLSPYAINWADTDLLPLVSRFLSRTEAMLERFQHLASRATGTGSLRPWDWEHAVWRLSAPYERYVPAADLAATLARGLRACGLIIDTQPLLPDLAPKWLPLPNSGWPAVDWLAVPVSREDQPGPAAAAKRLPRPEVGLAVDPRPGTQRAFASLAHATGVGLGVLLCRAGHLAERSSAGGFDPGAAALAALLAEPNFLAGQTDMPRSEISMYLAVGCPQAGVLRAMHLRRVAAMAAAVWQAVQEPGTDPATLAQHWLRQATGMSWDGALVGLDLATMAELSHWPAAFLSELGAGQVVGYLRREHGRLMGDRRTGECLVECFWRHGGLATLPRAIELASGQPFDEGAEVDALLVQAGM